MKDFGFNLPQNILFGKGRIEDLAKILNDKDIKSCLLVSDRGLEKVGVTKKLEDVINGAGVKCNTFYDVVPNPTVEIVNACLAAYKDSKSECIIALGGGSSIDVAEAASVLATYGGEITDYEGLDKVPGPVVPVVAIPTTAGTGSEVTASIVVTDLKRNYKFSVISMQILPEYAILDPQLIMTIPAFIAAPTGIDALVHAIEAYISKEANPFTDAFAEKAMELIGQNIRAFVADRQNEDAACAMMLGSNFAGLAFARAKLGDVHALSHPVSAYFNVPHGVANAILLPTVMEFNALADRGRFEKIYNYVSIDKEPVKNFKPEMLVEELTKLNALLGIPAHLADVGVEEDKIELMANDAMKSVNVRVNPRATTVKDCMAMYKKAM